VYDGALVSGQVAPCLESTRWRPVELPIVRVSPGSQRFVLMEGAWCTCGAITINRRILALDLATGSKSAHAPQQSGTLGTFDVTPDGKHIVFDRSRENSHIVLIERPK